MSGGLFGGYQKLLDKVYTGNPEIDAKLDNAAKNYSDTNNYRTHKVLNEISLTQTLGAEADPVSAAANAEPSLQGDVPSPKTNIPQNGNSVNTLAIRAVSNPKVSQIYNWGIKNDTSLGGVRHTPFGSNPNGTSSDVSAKNIPQNGSSVNTPDAENSAAKAQQRKPGTVSAEQMYGVKLSQENKCMPL